MTNLEKLKTKSAEEMAELIDDRGGACHWCAYDYDTCSGEDCEYGITRFLEREEDKNDA